MADKGLLASLRDDPATKALGQAAGRFAAAQASRAVTSTAQRISSPAGKRAQTGDEEGKKETKKVGGIKGMFSRVTGAMKGLFRRGGAAKRPTNITDEFFIGMPVEKVYEEWANFEQHAGYMKGVEQVSADKVEEGEDQTHQWKAKIFLSRRSWKSTITEQVENKRIRWTTEAPKGTIDGVITFHRLDDELTLVIYVLEYRPKGLMEWTGNRWRTVGRRARLDMKHFKRHVMLSEQEESDEAGQAQGEDTGEEGRSSGEDRVVAPPEGRGDAEGGEAAGPEGPEEGEGGEEGVTRRPAPRRRSREPESTGPKSPRSPRHTPRTPRRPKAVS